VLVCVLGLGASGCGGSKIATVSGIVTLDGKPLANATVSFQPISSGKDVNPGLGSLGRTDDYGRYKLAIVGEGTGGALVGKHRVEISRHVKDATDPQSDRIYGVKSLIPAIYNTKSELTFEVPSGGTTEANFELFSTPKKK
jgi:hypothetical protein